VVYLVVVRWAAEDDEAQVARTEEEEASAELMNCFKISPCT
jgi:hypothetical protein